MNGSMGECGPILDRDATDGYDLKEGVYGCEVIHSCDSAGSISATVGISCASGCCGRGAFFALACALGDENINPDNACLCICRKLFMVSDDFLGVEGRERSGFVTRRRPIGAESL